MADTVIKTLGKLRELDAHKRELDAHQRKLDKHKRDFDKLKPKLERLAKRLLNEEKAKSAGKKKPRP